VALYITNSPVPFINKVQRPTENVNPSAGGQLPDPNRPLYSNRAMLPVAPPDRARDAAPAAVDDKAAPKAPGPAPAPTTTTTTTADDGPRLMLQTGAFKSAQDADAMRARLALLGLDARVSQVTLEGATVLYRVRMGPYRGLDDLSGIRRTLSENGIEAQVVHGP
jgi:cell division protein FtsN